MTKQECKTVADILDLVEFGPTRFEIVSGTGEREHITVCDRYEHPYTKEWMRCIRIDGLAPNSVTAVARYEIVNEDQFKLLLDQGKD